MMILIQTDENIILQNLWTGKLFSDQNSCLLLYGP